MIYGLWHPGSGVGDQLFCYLAARIKAAQLEVPFTMAGEFKGKDFISFNKEVNVIPAPFVEYPAGKILISGLNHYEGTDWYDPEFDFVGDNTIVDGCRCQDERYFEGIPLGEWIQSKPLDVPDDTCVINFRGGEFTRIPELFLPAEYWNEAIRHMEARGVTKFEVHTDDVDTARQFFPNFEITHDVGLNWRSVRYAKNAIIANSAFGIIPRLLAGGFTIAPRYWARRNLTYWSTPQNYYKKFFYI